MTEKEAILTEQNKELKARITRLEDVICDIVRTYEDDKYKLGIVIANLEDELESEKSHSRTLGDTIKRLSSRLVNDEEAENV